MRPVSLWKPAFVVTNLEGHYIELKIDQYYLSGHKEYHVRHHLHQNLIYGYDNHLHTFLTLGYSNSGKIKKHTIQYMEMKRDLKRYPDIQIRKRCEDFRGRQNIYANELNVDEIAGLQVLRVILPDGSGRRLPTLNLSKNIKLKELELKNIMPAKLDLRKNTKLKSVKVKVKSSWIRKTFRKNKWGCAIVKSGKFIKKIKAGKKKIYTII